MYKKLALGGLTAVALAFVVIAGTSATATAQDAANACKGLDEAACTAADNKDCRWVPARVVDGKERPAQCRPVPANPCKGLDEAACTANADKKCKWITNATNAKGKPRKPFCRRVGKKKN